MKAIMIMFDSLNREYLPSYGCSWTKLPNFRRLAEKTLCFDNFYGGSMPCMPTRRELQTGRYNFLHRSWGPMEPFDDSMPEILKQNGIYSHLVTDHYHYLEDGGATYHHRYSTWDVIRGQEGDLVHGQVKDPEIPEVVTVRDFNESWRQDWVNRKFQTSEEEMPQAITFAKGLDFIDRNIGEDDWFLQIETFDPHEPFYTQKVYKDLYPHEYEGPHYDWPLYGNIPDQRGALDHVKMEYAALLSMCDLYLGKVLDRMDEHDMWKDTMLIVNTDHGFLLGEKEWMGKNLPPWYNEVINIPFFLYDPRSGRQNERRSALTQTVDIAPTLLEFFGLDIPRDMTGKPLRPVAEKDEKIRDSALFGSHGGHVSVTDGRYVYMRASGISNKPLNEYTLMPTNMRSMMPLKLLRKARFGKRFSFTKGVPLMKIPAGRSLAHSFLVGNLLFDLKKDPKQLAPVDDHVLESRMSRILASAMRENDSPGEQYRRLRIGKQGLRSWAVMLQKLGRQRFEKWLRLIYRQEFSGHAFEGLLMLLSRAPRFAHTYIHWKFKRYLGGKGIKVISDDVMKSFFREMMPPRMSAYINAFYEAATRRR